MKIMDIAMLMCLVTEVVFGRATGILLCVILYLLFKFVIKKDEHNIEVVSSKLQGNYNFWSGIRRPIKILGLIPKGVTYTEGGISACVGAYLSFRIMASVISFLAFFLLDRFGYDIDFILNLMYEITIVMLIIFSIIMIVYAIKTNYKNKRRII